MRISSDFEYLFSAPGAKRWLTRSRLPKPAAIFPRSLRSTASTPDSFIYSTDPAFLTMTEYLAEELTKQFPAAADRDGFAGPNATPSDFYNVLNVSGFGMDPAPIPLLSNAELLKESGIAATCSPKHRFIIRELARLFFGRQVPSSLRIRRDASFGFPFFTSDVEYKKRAVLNALIHLDRFLDLAAGNDKEDLRDLLNEFHAIYLYAIQERQQPNRIVKSSDGGYSSKPRLAPREQDVRTRSSHPGYANMNLDLPSPHSGKHFRMRRRDVFGMNGVINYVLTAILQPCRDQFLDDFAFTYKTRGSEDKLARVSKFKYIVGSDVKTMDKLIPEWFIDDLLAEASHYLDDRVIKIIKRCFKATFVAPYTGGGDSGNYNPVFGANPLIPDGNPDQFPGLPSGIAINPDVGKLWMTFVYLALFCDSGVISSASQIAPFLRGENPHGGLLDMSDDAVLMANSTVLHSALRAAKSPYAVLEPETPVIFLGDVFFRDSEGKIAVSPNPVSYVVNVLARETSLLVGDKKNAVKAWADGFLARSQVYAKMPIYRDISYIFDSAVEKHLGINLRSLARTFSRFDRISDPDAELLLNPSAIYYKIDPSEVTPAILESIHATIPSDVVWPRIKHLYKGT